VLCETSGSAQENLLSQNSGDLEATSLSNKNNQFHSRVFTTKLQQPLKIKILPLPKEEGVYIVQWQSSSVYV